MYSKIPPAYGYINVWMNYSESRDSWRITPSWHQYIEDAMEEISEGGYVSGPSSYLYSFELFGDQSRTIDLEERLAEYLRDLEEKARHERGLRGAL